ncbi:MAG: hypothetical protein P8Y44_06225, partial [Acidobacteriota bacterium]
MTGGNDITKNTAGVTISLVTKRGSNEPRGSARFLLTEGDGYFGVLEQAESGFDPDDLGPGQDDFVGNSIDRLQEYGFEAGGPAWRNHLWLWGAWSQRNLSKIAGNAEPELFVLESEAIKVNAQLSAANSLVASFNNTDKRAAGRGAAPNRDRSSTLNQRGPTGITKVEDSHVFGSSFFLSGAYSYVDGGFEFAALGGSGPDRPPIPGPGGEKNRDANGFVTNQFSGKTSTPHEMVKVDASYFLSTGGVGHEVRFGGRLRETQRSSTFSYPGRNIIHYHRDAAFEILITPDLLEMFGLSPTRLPDAHLLYAYRGGAAAPSVVDSRSLWLQDTLTWSRWTVNAGLRYDFEEGENRAATVEANLGFPEVMPSIEFEGNDGGGFTWETLSPRLGVTYALGVERKTLLRASLSRFPESLVHGDIRRTNPVSGQLAAMVFLDEPGGFPAFYDDGETFAVIGGFFGFDPDNPTALSSSNITDPEFAPALLDELVVGVEHAFLPEFVTGINLTWRRNERIGEDQPLFRDSLTGEIRTVAADEYLFAGQITGELPDGTPYSWDRFAVPPHLQATGGDFLTHGDRSIESFSAALSFTKRLSNR